MVIANPTLFIVLIFLIVVIVIWEAIWKGIGMWKAGRNNQLAWFIVILLINTIGILPIVYLLWFQKKKK
jgi:hypothetical protein